MISQLRLITIGAPELLATMLRLAIFTVPSEVASTGGGRYNNIFRNPARLDIYIFVPRGWGLPPALDYAEQAAALFRSFRDDKVSCFDATVYAGGDGRGLTPPGLTSEVGNYFYAVVEANVWYDQIG